LLNSQGSVSNRDLQLDESSRPVFMILRWMNPADHYSWS